MRRGKGRRAATGPTRRGCRSPRPLRGLLALFVLLALGTVASPGAAAAEEPDPSAPSDSSVDAVVDDRGGSLGDVAPEAGREAEAELEREVADGEIPNPDPWEPFNRKIFWVNEKADIYAVAPVARGWRFVVPGFARKAIENFNGLLIMPVVLGNGILQLKPKNAAQDVGRIVYNVH